jgi:hypothetical protein
MIIKGTGFVDGLTVTFGGSDATSIVVVDAFTITCLTPAHAVGSVDVVVTNPDGQAATLTNGFAYSDTWVKEPDDRLDGPPEPPGPDRTLDDPLAPTVTSVNAPTGPTTGGTKVRVIGTEFVRGATVTFDGVAVQNITYVNSKAIQVTTNAHALGGVDVVVTNPDGKSGSLTNGYAYLPPAITLTSVTPIFGTTLGGDTLTIQGTGFIDPMQVLVGGLYATNVTVVNTETLTLVTPANIRGETIIEVALV